jgi:hypothetical protein
MNKKNNGWINVNSLLPNDGQKVLILDDDNDIEVAVFCKGKSKKECEMCGIIESADQYGNNLVPYNWESDKSWFGQEITYWMPLPKLPNES